MILPVRRAAASEGVFALFAQQINDWINQGRDQRVLGGLREGEMKLQIGFDECIGIIQRALHQGNGLADRFDLFGRRAGGGARGDFGFQNLARFGKIQRALRRSNTEHESKCMTNRARGSIGDECAAPRVTLDESFLLQDFDCFAHDGTTDAKLTGKFALGREPVAVAQFAAEDLVFDLRDDLLVEPGGLKGGVVCGWVYWYYHHTNSRWHGKFCQGGVGALGIPLEFDFRFFQHLADHERIFFAAHADCMHCARIEFSM